MFDELVPEESADQFGYSLVKIKDTHRDFFAIDSNQFYFFHKTADLGLKSWTLP